MSSPKLNKHQMRTKTTRAALLEAAERIFVRDGFERAQIDEIASEAGRTRGAVYTHFETKEHLFLSLLEHHMNETVQYAREFIEREGGSSPSLRLKALKKYYSEKRGAAWAILRLEFKLFALRHPTSMEELRALYKRTYAFETFPVTYGVREQRGRPKIQSRLFALNAITSSLMLETHVEPAALDNSETKLLLEEIFECFFYTETRKVTAPANDGRARKRHAR